MGTKVQCESYFRGYFSMRDLNENSNGCSWPLYYGDKTFTNGQYYSGFLPRSIADVCPGYDKDVVKRTMLEHEAIFKIQLNELHRLYRIQRDLMDEVRGKEPNKNCLPVATSFSSSPLASQITSEDARKWLNPGFPLTTSVCARPSASGIEDIHSPMSSMKVGIAQASPLPSQNGVISKDVEILDSRPSKVRRKMFDLHLPADEYIDTEEGGTLGDENVSGMLSYLPNGNRRTVPEGGKNLFLGNGGDNNFQGDLSQSALCSRSRNNVADLNEPIEVEDADSPVYANRLVSSSSHDEIRGHEYATEPKSEFLGFSKDLPLKIHHGSANGAANNPRLHNSANGIRWFPHVLDADQNLKNTRSVSQGVQQEKSPASSQPTQILFNKTHEPPTVSLTDQSKGNQLRETTVHVIEFSERNNEMSNTNHPESVATSYLSSLYPFGPSDLGKSRSQSVSSWEKSSRSLSQKSSAVPMHSYLNSSATLCRSSLSSTQTHVVLGDRWNYNGNSASKPSLGTEMPRRNGFYHGSSSGTKDLLGRVPSGNWDYLNCHSADNTTSGPFNNHSSAKFCKTSNCVESNSPKDGNLNMGSVKATPQPDIQVIDLERKHDDYHVALPWLRSKPACKDEATNAGMDWNKGELGFLQSSMSQFSNKNAKGESSNQIGVQDLNSASCANIEASKIEISDSSSCRKILGFPIFEKEHTAKNGPSLISPAVPLPRPPERVENSGKNIVLDMNLPCDLAFSDFDQQTAEEDKPNVANSRHLFDLNSCMSGDEASLIPSVPDSHVKIVVEIDLEAPAVPETEEDVIPEKECLEKAQETPLELPQEHKAETLRDELVREAAEAIVALSLSDNHNHVVESSSNPLDTFMTDPLHWFVEVASSIGEDLESKLDTVSGAKYSEHNESPPSEEIDYFESMTLKLIETKEEDYMPEPLVPENLKLEETETTPLPARTRRGPGRRGRQRRDFRRDILPGLASLSRHEVTEDLQTFSGLMRAMGHLWHSGLMRRNSTRNGCTRGRRRVVVSPSPTVTETLPWAPMKQQLNTCGAGLEDTSLTGWGKTTRRPRRQRCPAGNPPSIPLT